MRARFKTDPLRKGALLTAGNFTEKISFFTFQTCAEEKGERLPLLCILTCSQKFMIMVMDAMPIKDEFDKIERKLILWEVSSLTRLTSIQSKLSSTRSCSKPHKYLWL